MRKFFKSFIVAGAVVSALFLGYVMPGNSSPLNPTLDNLPLPEYGFQLKYEVGKASLVSDTSGLVKSVMSNDGQAKFFYITSNKSKDSIAEVKFKVPLRNLPYYILFKVTNVRYGFTKPVAAVGTRFCFPFFDVLTQNDNDGVRLSSFSGYNNATVHPSLLRDVANIPGCSKTVAENIPEGTTPGVNAPVASFSPESYLTANVSYQIYSNNGINKTSTFNHDLLFSDLDAGRFRPDDVTREYNKSLSYESPGSPINWASVPRITPGFGVPEAVRLNSGVEDVIAHKFYNKQGEPVKSGNLAIRDFRGATFFSNLDDKDSKDDFSLDSVRDTGFWAQVAPKASANFTVQTYYCWTYIQIFSTAGSTEIKKQIVAPKQEYRVGDTVNYRVEIPLPEKFKSGVKTYSSLVATDNLPKGLELQSVSSTNPSANQYLTKNRTSFTFNAPKGYLDNLFQRNTNKLVFNISALVTYNASDISNCIEVDTNGGFIVNGCANSTARIIKPTPRIKVEKWGNNINVSGKTKEGAGRIPEIEKGSQVTFRYRVTNTGEEPLRNVVVRDDKLGVLSCPKNTLGVNESMICSKNGAV